MYKSNNTLINAVLANSQTNNKVEFALYGTDGKALFEAFQTTAYNLYAQPSEEARNAAFEAGRAVLALYNVNLPSDRRIKFDGVEELSEFSRLAVKRSSVKSARVQELEVYKTFALYRKGERASASYTGKDYCALCKLIGYTPSREEKAGYLLPVEQCDAVLLEVERLIAEEKAKHTNSTREDCLVNLGTFAKDVECIVARKINRALAKTAEEIAEEKKAKNAARRAAREKAAKAAAKAAKAAEKNAEAEEKNEQAAA